MRRILENEARSVASLGVWVLGRRHGVRPGDTAASYSGGQTAVMTVLLVALVGEAVAVEIILRAVGAPDLLRHVLLAVDVGGVVLGLAAVAARVTRPHVVSEHEVRVRSGAYFDARVPRRQVAAVRGTKRYDAPSTVSVDGRSISVAVSGQINVVLELARPLTVVRPLGGTAEVDEIRFFADDPAAVIDALSPHRRSGASRDGTGRTTPSR